MSHSLCRPVVFHARRLPGGIEKRANRMARARGVKTENDKNAHAAPGATVATLYASLCACVCIYIYSVILRPIVCFIVYHNVYTYNKRYTVHYVYVYMVQDVSRRSGSNSWTLHNVYWRFFSLQTIKMKKKVVSLFIVFILFKFSVFINTKHHV